MRVDNVEMLQPVALVCSALVVLGATACRAREAKRSQTAGPGVVVSAKAATLAASGVPSAPERAAPLLTPPLAASASVATRDPRVLVYAKPSAAGVREDDVPSQGCDQALALGRRSAGTGDWASAAKHFVRAVGCDPDSAMARGELGNAELRRGNVEGAITILREAEGVAPPGAVQRAIAHNLAKAFEAANASEMAQRARSREARLLSKAHSGDSGSACPVVVIRNDASIKQGSWLEAYGEIGFDDAPKPKTQDDARRLCCWSRSAGDVAKLADDCEQLDTWSIENWTSAFASQGNFVWRLGHDRAAWSTAYAHGGTFCPLDEPSSASGVEAWRVADFIAIEVSRTSYVPDLPSTPGTSAPCVAVGVTRKVDLFDLGLGKGFSLLSLAADVRVELEPEQHAVRLQGPFCDERVSLASVP